MQYWINSKLDNIQKPKEWDLNIDMTKLLLKK